jgi:hypothetical protein
MEVGCDRTLHSAVRLEGSDSGIFTGEKCWVVINKENYLLKTVTEECRKQRFSLSVKNKLPTDAELL